MKLSIYGAPSVSPLSSPVSPRLRTCSDIKECDGRKHTDVKEVMSVPQTWTMEAGNGTRRRWATLAECIQAAGCYHRVYQSNPQATIYQKCFYLSYMYALIHHSIVAFIRRLLFFSLFLYLHICPGRLSDKFQTSYTSRNPTPFAFFALSNWIDTGETVRRKRKLSWLGGFYVGLEKRDCVTRRQVRFNLDSMTEKTVRVLSSISLINVALEVGNKKFMSCTDIYVSGDEITVGAVITDLLPRWPALESVQLLNDINPRPQLGMKKHKLPTMPMLDTLHIKNIVADGRKSRYPLLRSVRFSGASLAITVNDDFLR